MRNSKSEEMHLETILILRKRKSYACLINVDVSVCGVEMGVSHAGPDEFSFDACSVRHGCVGMAELSCIELG